jgi:hypothetical protein
MLRATSPAFLVAFAEGVAAEEVFSEVRDRVVQCLARITWFEAEFTRGFGAIEVPEILGHFDGARLNGRR